MHYIYFKNPKLKTVAMLANLFDAFFLNCYTYIRSYFRFLLLLCNNLYHITVVNMSF